MYHKIEDFNYEWGFLNDGTVKMLEALTDDSLKQPISDGHRDIGRIAWHIVTTIPEMMERVGFKLVGPTEKDPVPSAAKIIEAYKMYAKALAEQVNSNWKDETLEVEDDMYGMKWKRGLTLRILINHEIHHRGQMTVLMRQAGLKIPGVFGPSKEEWAENNMPEPEL